MAAQDDNDEDINPITMILPDGHNDVGANSLSSIIQEGKQEQQKHFLPSINSTVVIRQLPSEGIGFQLWPAATTLVSLLDQYRCDVAGSTPLFPALSALSNGSNSRPLCILELGSGTGMVGIAAAITLGANVTVTDLPHVVPNLQFNADANASILAENGGTVYVAPLRWGHADDVELIGREFDFILASDVVYHDHLFDPLLQTLRLLLSDGVGVRVAERKMVFVMAHLKRWKKESVFFKKAKKLFEVEVLHVDGPSQGSRTGVVIYRFVGKGQKKSIHP